MALIPHLEKQLRALSHFRRLHMLRLLKKKRPYCSSELAEAVGIKKFAASQHLRILKNVGILESRKRGRYVTYRISLKQSPVVQDVLKHL